MRYIKKTCIIQVWHGLNLILWNFLKAATLNVNFCLITLKSFQSNVFQSQWLGSWENQSYYIQHTLETMLGNIYNFFLCKQKFYPFVTYTEGGNISKVHGEMLSVGLLSRKASPPDTTSSWYYATTSFLVN